MQIWLLYRLNEIGEINLVNEAGESGDFMYSGDVKRVFA